MIPAARAPGGPAPDPAGRRPIRRCAARLCLCPLAPLESPAPCATRKSPRVRPVRREPHPDQRLEVSMPSVRVRENEYFDAALRRFKRACEKAGILTELRRREFYEKPTQERKRKKAAAIKRHMKRVSRDGMRTSR